MSGELKGIKDFYNAVAEKSAEEWYPNEMMLPLLQKFTSLFSTKPLILDAGCGAGYESMRLVNLGAEVVGIDFSEESIKIARLRNPNCRFEVMDCKYLDTDLGIFDGIVSIALIVHIQDTELKIIFDNFKKVVTPSGFLFIAFVEGDGFSESRSYLEINGERYNRSFYLHCIDRICATAKNSGFEYYTEWFLEETHVNWKYLVFQKT